MTARICAVFLLLITLAAVFAPVVTRHGYAEQNIEHRLEGPSHEYWMGTDSLGRDVYSRVVYGARMSLAVGVLTAVFALLVGTLTGAAAGFLGGWTDQILMRVVDVIYIFPSLLLAILLTVLLGRGIFGILAAISFTSWVTQARLVRGQVLLAREMPYVEAARALGLPSTQVVLKHILPNLRGPILVSIALQIPTNILAESYLSFLGLGIQPPYSSWGTLAAEGFHAMRSQPHLIIFPGVALFLTVMALTYLAEAL
jgi:oligopeptide transport system permease protein